CPSPLPALCPARLSARRPSVTTLGLPGGHGRWNARVDRFLFAPEHLARELPPSPTTPAATSPATSSLTHAVPFRGLDAEAGHPRATHLSARRGGQAKRTREAAQHPAARDPASRHHPNAEGQPTDGRVSSFAPTSRLPGASTSPPPFRKRSDTIARSARRTG